MAHEDGFQRYFTYLNLFMGAMLLLVLGNNYLVTFVGWEGVGLCSYLLIGFYYDQEFPPYAGRKAFIVNRIGDFALHPRPVRAGRRSFGTLQVHGGLSRGDRGRPGALRDAAVRPRPHRSPGFVALCLFIGAMGKIAQIPLYVWLPDAMAGPTPVSALIHAATMVTAGVYMVVRSNVLVPARAGDLAGGGGGRRGDGALRGDDRPGAERHQEGAGVLDGVAARLHVPGGGRGRVHGGDLPLMTHAFFKALLFLGSGSVIHAMRRRAGHARGWAGLRKHLPVTYRTFLIGTLAIAGHPAARRVLLQGRDPGRRVRRRGTTVLWAVGLLTAGLTACYMFRAVYLTFHGEFRGTHEQEPPPARVAAGDDGAADGAGGGRGGCGLGRDSAGA